MLAAAGGAAVLPGAEQQSRVPEAAGDVRVEPGGGQHADVGQLRIGGQAEVPFSPRLRPGSRDSQGLRVGAGRIRPGRKPGSIDPEVNQG